MNHSAKAEEDALTLSLGRLVSAAFPRMALVLSVLFACLTVTDYLPPTDESFRFALVDATCSVIFGAAFAYTRRRGVPARFGNAATAGVVLVILANIFHGYTLSVTPAKTLYVMVLAVGAASVLLSWRWLALSMAGLVGTWLLFSWPYLADPLWTTYRTGLIASVGCALIVHHARYRAYRGLEAIRLEDERLKLDLAGAVREARHAEERYRTVVRGAPIALFATDAAGTVTFVEGNARLGGLTARAFTGRSAEDAFADAPTVAAHVRRALAGEEGAGITEFHGRTFETRYSPIRDEAGVVTGVVGVATDVSDRERADRLRRESEERLLLVGRASSDVIWDWDLKSNAITWNDNFERVFGHARHPSTLDLAFWSAQIHPDDVARVSRTLDAAVHEGRDAWTEEYRFRRADGSFATVIDRGFLVRDDEGAPARMIGAMMDVTERKRSEETLRQREKLSALGTLVAGVAHEINNPLAFMRSAVELTREDLTLVAESEALTAANRKRIEDSLQMSSTVLEGIDRIGHITRSLKRVARSGSIERQAVEIAPLVDTVLTVAAPRLKKGITVEREVSTTRAVLGSESELAQVLLNLVLNAADALAGAPTARIVVRAVDRADGVALEVEDSGPGIPGEVRERIFTPFFTTKATGTGLGLSISHQIAADHGGTLSFVSEPGKTCFTLEFPPAAVTVPPVDDLAYEMSKA